MSETVTTKQKHLKVDKKFRVICKCGAESKVVLAPNYDNDESYCGDTTRFICESCGSTATSEYLESEEP